MNNLYGNFHIPDFKGIIPTFFIEHHNLVFDNLLQKIVADYLANIQAPRVKTHSVYYYAPEDFLAYQAFKCMSNRSSLEKPELDYCSSDSFNFLDWQKTTNKI
jgi:DNA polymerase III alpha subunit